MIDKLMTVGYAVMVVINTITALAIIYTATHYLT